MTFASVCSGIEAASVAWLQLGWKCAFTAEIEGFPSATLHHHYPDTPNYGDITKFKEWPGHSIDVLVGGTPCQSFSVAGLRKGISDPRGNLALVFLGIVDQYRPTWVLWENVPGVHSSWSNASHPRQTEASREAGRIAQARAVEAGFDAREAALFGEFEEVDQSSDFDCFLSGLAELGYGIATTVLDAQFFGLAQRRERVFVVGHSGGQWQRAAAVLFDAESLRGNPAPRRSSGQGTAPTISARTQGGGGRAVAEGQLIPEISPAIKQRDYKGPSSDGDGDGLPLLPVAFQPRIARNGRGDMGDAVNALQAQSGQTGKGDAAPCVATGYAVRRLTPKECEKLQGFTTSLERFTIQLCYDRQSKNVDVGLKCRKLPNSALHAEQDVKCGCAPSADTNLQNDLESLNSIAHLHVRISHEAVLRAFHNQGRCLLCAKDADDQNLSRQPMPIENIAPEIARLWLELDRLVTDGKEGSQQNIKSFILPNNGNPLAAIFGLESEDCVKGATKNQRNNTQCITSNLGHGTQTSDSQLQTLLCSVVYAIGSCIPKPTSKTNSVNLIIDVESDYTLLPGHKADGPRYKALGNSMAVPVMRWIGQRIAHLEARAEK